VKWKEKSKKMATTIQPFVIWRRYYSPIAKVWLAIPCRTSIE